MTATPDAPTLEPAPAPQKQGRIRGVLAALGGLLAPVARLLAPVARFLAKLRTMLTRNLRQSGILIAFVLIVLVFSLFSKNFLSPGNLTNIVLQYTYILILAIGMVIVIIAGHIDLSVGSLVALTGAVAATVVIKDGMPWYFGVLAALVVGALVGMWQGFWVAFVGIPAFIVTLAGMLLFRGLTAMVLSNTSLSPFGGTYYQIANGFQNGLFGCLLYTSPSPRD